MSSGSQLSLVPDPPDSEDDGRGGGGSNFERRLSSLETHIQYLATKEDIQKVKVWVLGGVLGGMGIAAAITVGIFRLLY
ncbi:MAG: hypothetical protein OXE44_00760 [Nitrospinae bacterium]|nr:hypothetical protein [Nitrospinota bacterium]